MTALRGENLAKRLAEWRERPGWVATAVGIAVAFVRAVDEEVAKIDAVTMRHPQVAIPAIFVASAI